MAIGDVSKAKQCLARVGYYRLSAYWYPFRRFLILPNVGRGRPLFHTFDEFVPGTKFEEVIDFYVYDKELRLLVSDALERIEICLRAQVANLLGARDMHAHRSAAQLHGDFTTKRSRRNNRFTRHQDWLHSQDDKFNKSKEDFADHFRKKYNGLQPPIWVATEVWDWGMLSHFVDGMRHSDTNAVASHYGKLTGKELVTWVHALNDVRNICAHHSRLWNRGLKVQPKFPPMGDLPELDHIQGNTHSQTRLYCALLIMCIMMRNIHPATEWHKRVVDLVTRAPTNPIIDLNAAGFPMNWEQEAIWK
ncbi:Abi family protein [Defluviimonas aestuarii]|uniref:Abi family protein n=1 Tax=Albidovulum aestuarii TaxID=1130726 RepID=UPI00249C5FCC|nr:Abi family protein [Defluviimonas aestuarii]MDI3338001.1 Abi family protein [Defluviimonas aestuarii]